MTISRRSALLSMTATALLARTQLAGAQAYPSKPIRLLVPFGAGTGVDVTARIFAQFLSEEMKVGVVVENRDGAGGIIGTVAGAQSTPDGYTLMFVSEPITSAHMLQPEVTYDPVKEFKPIGRVVSNPLTVVAGKDQPFKTFKEMVAYIKEHPGKVQYATSGKGSSSHLETALIMQRYGLEAIDIPYKAFGPAITDVIAGRVAFFLSALSALLPHIKSGSVIALANSTKSAVIPDVPSMQELYNEPKYEGGVWYGMLAPAKTPDDIVKYVYDKVQTVMKNPDLKQKIEAGGSNLAPMPPDQFEQLIKDEVVRWGKVLDSLGLRALKT